MEDDSAQLSLRERLARYESVSRSTPDAGVRSTASSVSAVNWEKTTLEQLDGATNGKRLSTSIKALTSVFASPTAPVEEVDELDGQVDPLLDFKPHLERVEAHDPQLTWLDLSGNRRFMALGSEHKSDTIRRFVSGEKLETLILNSVALDNANALALASALRQTTTLHGISLENNGVMESGLLAIAQALRGHPSLTEVSVANQKRPLPTSAIERLLDAMEATPTIIHIGLGTLRDDMVRKRHQAATMANVEAMRQRRLQAAQSVSSGGDSFDVAPAAKVLQRRSVSFERPKRRPAVEPEADDRPKARRPSIDMRMRMRDIAGIVGKVIETTSRVCEWGQEARFISHSLDHQHGFPLDDTLGIVPPAGSKERDPWQVARLGFKQIEWVEAPGHWQGWEDVCAVGAEGPDCFA